MLFEISSIGESRISRMRGANPRNGIEFLKTFAENGMKVKEIGLVILKSLHYILILFNVFIQA